MTESFSTGTSCGACYKYEVCVTSLGSAPSVKLLQIGQTGVGFTIKLFRPTLPCKISPILHIFHETCVIFNWFLATRFPWYDVIQTLISSGNREIYAAMIVQRNSYAGKLPNYNIKKQQSNKSPKQRRKTHFSHSTQIELIYTRFEIDFWYSMKDIRKDCKWYWSGCWHSQMCSPVKWSVGLNDLSDFGVTDEWNRFRRGCSSWTIY